MLVDVLHPELEGGDEAPMLAGARRQRAFEPLGEVAADVERGEDLR